MSSAHDPVNRYFELSLFFMLAVGFLTLAGTGKMDLFTVSLMGAALAARALLLWRGSSFRFSAQWVFRMTLGYIPFYFLDLLLLLRSYDSPLERLLLATIHLIFFTAILKMFSAEIPRDYLYLAALAFAQMLSAATLTVHLSFLFYFAVFLLLSIATFTSFEIKRARDRVGGPLGAALPPPGEGKLASALTATSAVICLGTVILSAILFFVIPRARSGYFSSLAGPTERFTGFSDNVELGEIGQIKKLSTVVMHVQAPGLSPFQAIKWRGIGLTTFDGKRWSNPKFSSSTVTGVGNFHFHRELSHPGQHTELLRYSITLQPISSDALFLAPQPLELTGPFRNLWQDEAGSIYLGFNSGSMIRYSAVSDITSPAPDSLRGGSGEIPLALKETYLQMPSVDARVADLALEITRQQSSVYDKAKAIESYLQKNYGYTLDLHASMPQDPIAYFLFEARRGHCEFFASAMVIMLRTLGIPSRLVNGFLQGGYNDISGNYTVRASDAHTWVEVYFPTYGWVSFDPTPPEGRATQALLLGRLTLFMDAFQTLWDEWVINYDFLHQITLARQLEGTTRQVTSNSRVFFYRHYRSLLRALERATDWLLAHHTLTLFFLALVMFGTWVLLAKAALSQWVRERRMLSRAHHGTSRPEDSTLAYLRLLRILSRRGIRKSAMQTPNEFAASVPEPAGNLVRDFTRLYLEARFGRLPHLIPRLNALLEEIRLLARARTQSEPRP